MAEQEQRQLLALGHGYTAKALAARLIKAGWSVSGTTREDDAGGPRHKAIAQTGATPVSWQADLDLFPALRRANHLLVSTPPDESGCPSLRALKAWRASCPEDAKPAWIGVLSSNGVYGDHGGAWVDENTPPQPTSPRGKRRVAAEAAWLAFADRHDIPLQIFRLPGIYGPGRSAIDQVRAGTAKRIIKPGQVFSRMHVDDIAGALIAGIKAKTTLRVFNLADDEPSPPQDVVTYACTLLGIKPPPEQNIDDADLSPMGRSFYADNKRVRNTRMKEVLGYLPAYPTFREGLEAIIADGL